MPLRTLPPKTNQRITPSQHLAHRLRQWSWVNEITYINEKKMPKLKTNSSAKKRFALTGSGKIKRKHAFKSHILTKKTKKQKRNLTYFTTVDKVDVREVKELLRLR